MHQVRTHTAYRRGFCCLHVLKAYGTRLVSVASFGGCGGARESRTHIDMSTTVRCLLRAPQHPANHKVDVLTRLAPVLVIRTGAVPDGSLIRAGVRHLVLGPSRPTDEEVVRRRSFFPAEQMYPFRPGSIYPGGRHLAMVFKYPSAGRLVLKRGRRLSRRRSDTRPPLSPRPGDCGRTLLGFPRRWLTATSEQCKCYRVSRHCIQCARNARCTRRACFDGDLPGHDSVCWQHISQLQERVPHLPHVASNGAQTDYYFCCFLAELLCGAHTRDSHLFSGRGDDIP